MEFGPKWSHEDANIVFDRHSGDYWVLTDLARKVLELTASTPLTSAQIAAQIQHEGLSPLNAGQHDAHALKTVIHELVHEGLLTQN